MKPAPLALRLTGITKRFGSLTANDDISLTLAQGEVLALLGAVLGLGWLGARRLRP